MMNVGSSSPMLLYFGANIIPRQFDPVSRETAEDLTRHLSLSKKDEIVEKFFDWQKEEFVKSHSSGTGVSPLTKADLDSILEPRIPAPGTYPIPKAVLDAKSKIQSDFTDWQRKIGNARFNEFATLHPQFSIPKDINTPTNSNSSIKEIDAYITRYHLPSKTKDEIATKFSNWQKEEFVKFYHLPLTETQKIVKSRPFQKSVKTVVAHDIRLTKHDLDSLFTFLTNLPLRMPGGYPASKKGDLNSIELWPQKVKLRVLSDFAKWQKKNEKINASQFIKLNPDIYIPWQGNFKKLMLTENEVTDLLAWGREKTEKWRKLIDHHTTEAQVSLTTIWAPLKIYADWLHDQYKQLTKKE
jgi:hypothetical protein